MTFDPLFDVPWTLHVQYVLAAGAIASAEATAAGEQ